MNELVGLLQFVAATGLLVAPVILIVRLIAGGEPVDLAELFRVRSEPTWPHGVQEEDTPGWHVERLHSPTRAGPAQGVADRSRRQSLPVQTGLRVGACGDVTAQAGGFRTSRRACRTIRANSRRWASGRMCDGAPA
jgi:hypothetical protein